MPLNTGPLTELELFDDELDDLTDDLLDDVATELEGLLDETAIDELDDLMDETELLLLPQDVNCALFLPTPATLVSLSFTHCADTAE